MKLNKTDAAKQLRVSRQTVYNFLNRGLLEADDEGLIELENIRNLIAALHDADPEGELMVGWGDSERQHPYVLTQSLHQSAAKLKGNLKDKYMASLEERIATQNRYLASLEEQVKTQQQLIHQLERQIKEQQSRMKELYDELFIHGGSSLWIEMLRDEIGVKSFARLSRRVEDRKKREYHKFNEKAEMLKNLATEIRSKAAAETSD